MNIFERENTEVGPTGERVRDDFHRPSAVTSVEHMNEGMPDPVSSQYVHRLQLRLFVQFNANRAQYEQALRCAKVQMLHFLYRDALAEISNIRKYTMDGDRGLIFEACERLEKAVGL